MAALTSLNELQKNGRIISGRWELAPGHRLRYRRDEDSRIETLEYETSLIAAEPDALVVSISGRQKDGRIYARTSRLTGQWRLNAKNQFEFEVKRQSGTSNVLTFKGSWKVGKSNEIIYSYNVRKLRTRTAVTHTLVFKGHWDIGKDHRLTYTLEGASDETFSFRGTFQTRSLQAKKGELRYQIGAELKGSRNKKTITLFGKWKMSDRLELSFELERESGRKNELRFGAEYHLNDSTTIAAQLTGRRGEPLGVEVILTREILDGRGQTFLRLRKTLQEQAVEAGVRVEW